MSVHLILTTALGVILALPAEAEAQRDWSGLPRVTPLLGVCSAGGEPKVSGRRGIGLPAPTAGVAGALAFL